MNNDCIKCYRFSVWLLYKLSQGRDTNMNVLKFLKIIATLAVLIFVIAGPTVFEAYKENSKEMTEEEEEKWKGIIVLWDYPTFDKENGTRYEWVMNKIKQFEKENRGVFIDFKPVNFDSCLIEIDTASKTNALPDIAPVACERDIQQSGLLEPLNDFISEEQRAIYIKDVIDHVTHNEYIYGIPRLIDLNIIAFNRYELENSNLDFPERIDWGINEFLDISGALYQNTGLPFIANEKTMYHIIQGIQGQTEYMDIGEINGFRKNDNIISEFESRNFSAISCSTMDLARFEYNFGSNAELKLITLYNEDEGQKLSGNCTAYGVFKQKDRKKLEMCVKLIYHLTDSGDQVDLWRFNAFPVLRDVSSIYNEDSDMGKLESLLGNSSKFFINNLNHRDRVDLMKIYNH